MRHSSFLISFLSIFSIITLGQIKNFKSMEGTWTGQWVNKYYQSTGNINLKLTVNETAQTAKGEWNVGGDILGQPRTPFNTDITFNSSSFSANFTSPIWGDIKGTGYFTGTYSGTSTNCPNPNAQAIAASGTFTNSSIAGTFNFTWYSTPITGTVTMTKQNPIQAPSNLQLTENPIKQINLTWNDNSTNETGFRIDRKDPITGNWSEIGTVVANMKTYSDKNLIAATTYTYRVASYSIETESEYSNDAVLKTATGINNKSELPDTYALLPNYPNPFNPATTLNYEIPEQSYIKITVYNMLGEIIEILVSQLKPAGKFKIVFNSQEKSSGVYIVKMEASKNEKGKGFVDFRKILLMK
jgi:hypothetical protein